MYTLARFFGLAGNDRRADVLFSTTASDAPRDSRTTATTHGGFDFVEDARPTRLETEPATGATNLPPSPRSTPRVPPVARMQRQLELSPRSKIGARTARPARRPSRARKAAPTPRKPWTVLVWMAGDNDLERFGLRDLDEMKAVGSSDAVDIVVQFDRMSDDRTRRYCLRRGTSLAADAVEELGETNTGDPEVAIDFFTWGIEKYPSDRVLAVIWNHGSGIDESDVYRRAAVRGITVARHVRGSAASVPRSRVRTMMSRRYRRALFATTIDEAMRSRAIAYDDTSRDFLDNTELKRVLTEVKARSGRSIDLLGFDACLMSMIEIAFQLRGTVDGIVGSEEVEPGDGWPYEPILGALEATPTMSPMDLGAVVVKQFVKSYTGESVTQSLLDTSQVESCAAAVDALAAAMINALRVPAEYVAIIKSLNATQRFDMEDYVDLGDFCGEVRARTKDAKVARAAQATSDAITTFVRAEAHKGTSVGDAHGVAIYFPRRAVSKVYGRLDFARRTRWDEFLTTYHGS